MKFLCDEMLAGLARWLRAAGYDTTMALPGTHDRALLDLARAQNRTLLTRDRAIVQIKDATNHTFVLETEGLDNWARELRQRLNLNWLADPLSRCLVCNVELTEASIEALARMPEDSRNGAGPFHECPKCHRGYWPGSHVRRMRKRLEGFSRHTPGHGGSETP